MEAYTGAMAVRKKQPPPARVWPATSAFDVVAIGTSAGGFTALCDILRGIRPDFQSSIVIVQHLDPHRKSQLANLLQRYSALTVKQAQHGEVLLPGAVYVAPPDEHLLVGPGKIQLAHTQMVHFSRPSVELMFESVE